MLWYLRQRCRPTCALATLDLARISLSMRFSQCRNCHTATRCCGGPSQILRCALSAVRKSEVGTITPRFMQATPREPTMATVVPRWHVQHGVGSQARPKPLHSLTAGNINVHKCICISHAYTQVSGHPDRNSAQRLRHILALGRSATRCSRPPSTAITINSEQRYKSPIIAPTTEVFHD